MPDVTITRALPADLLEVKAKYPDASIDEVIASMQEDATRTSDCPKCKVEDVPTGWVTNSRVGRIMCDLCGGMLKTNPQYIPDTNNPGQYVPVG